MGEQERVRGCEEKLNDVMGKEWSREEEEEEGANAEKKVKGKTSVE